jgi:phosphocarrier protein HPr
MLDRTVTVINPLGLHARAAAQLVRRANKFRCSVTLKRDDTGVAADAKSILNVLYIAATQGVEVHIVTDGEDESEAMQAVENLFTTGFGEI